MSIIKGKENIVTLSNVYCIHIRVEIFISDNLIKQALVYYFSNRDFRESNSTPLPVLLPGKSHGQRSLVAGHEAAKSRTQLK